ncbi:MAG: glycosyltransferase family 39 protein [Rhodocyclaceae bacterium]
MRISKPGFLNAPQPDKATSSSLIPVRYYIHRSREARPADGPKHAPLPAPGIMPDMFPRIVDAFRRNPANQLAAFSWLCLAAVLVCQFGIRAHYLTAGSLNVDESFFAACAMRAIAEHSGPLLACIDNKPPGVFLIYQVVFSLFGDYNMQAIHAFGMLWVFLTAGAIFLAASELGGRQAGIWACILFLLLGTGDPRFIAVKTEQLAALPLSLALWLMLRSAKRVSYAGFAGAGALTGVAMLFKQPAVLAAAGMSVLCLAAYTNGRRLRSTLHTALSYAGGLALPLAMAALYFSAAGGLEDLIYQTLEYPSRYATVDTTPLSRRLMRFVTATEEYSRLAPLCWLLAVLGVLATAGHRTNPTASGQSLPVRSFLLVSLLGAFAAVSLGREYYPAYYLFTFPALALAGGYFIQFCLQQESLILRRIALCTGALAIISSAVAAGTPIVKQLLSGSTPPTQSPITMRINALSQADDRLYVWGYAPDYFITTRLIGASKVLLTDHLQGTFAEYTPGMDPAARLRIVKPGIWQRFMKDLEDKPPRFIVDISGRPLGSGDAVTFSPDHYPEFSRYLKDRCRMELIDRGIALYVCQTDKAPPRIGATPSAPRKPT